MYAGAILHIYLIADPDKVYITSHYRIEPEAAIITCDHITYYSCIRSNEIVVAELREFGFYGKNGWHENNLEVERLRSL